MPWQFKKTLPVVLGFVKHFIFSVVDCHSVSVRWLLLLPFFFLLLDSIKLRGYESGNEMLRSRRPVGFSASRRSCTSVAIFCDYRWIITSVITRVSLQTEPNKADKRLSYCSWQKFACCISVHGILAIGATFACEWGVLTISYWLSSNP